MGRTLARSRARELRGANDRDVGALLPAWTRDDPRASLHVSMTSAPERWVTAWLAALAAAGRDVTWSGSPPPVAAVIEPRVDPDGGIAVAVAGPAAPVSASDDLGPIDSTRIRRVGASLESSTPSDSLTVRVGAQALVLATPPPVTLLPVAVVGRAGWEA